MRWSLDEKLKVRETWFMAKDKEYSKGPTGGKIFGRVERLVQVGNRPVS